MDCRECNYYLCGACVSVPDPPPEAETARVWKKGYLWKQSGGAKGADGRAKRSLGQVRKTPRKTPRKTLTTCGAVSCMTVCVSPV